MGAVTKYEEPTATAVQQAQPTSVFGTSEAFDHGVRAAKALAQSDLVPAQFKGNIANCLLALETAARVRVSPLAVMQNLYIVQGKPMWSAQFVIAAINASGRFSPLRFRRTDADGGGVVAWARDLTDGEVLEGPTVTMKMAADEGWLGKAGSKWKTMPELMLRYRAAAFFGRLYAPDILSGMRMTEEETSDFTAAERANTNGRGADGYRMLATQGRDVYEAGEQGTLVREPARPARPTSLVTPKPGKVADALEQARTLENARAAAAQPDPYEDDAPVSDAEVEQFWEGKRAESEEMAMELDDARPAPKKRDALREG